MARRPKSRTAQGAMPRVSKKEPAQKGGISGAALPAVTRRPGEDIIELEYYGKMVQVDPLQLLQQITEENVIAVLETYDRDRSWVQTLAFYAKRRVEELQANHKRIIGRYQFVFKMSGQLK